LRLGFVGLGRMGSSMVERLLLDNHEVVAYDVSELARNLAAEMNDKKLLSTENV
jgi:6-phosphogluconate dehydrogenase (decarboxylating)